MNTDNQMSHLSLFVSGNTWIYKAVLAVLLKCLLKCRLYRRLASVIDVHLNVIWGRRAHLLSNEVRSWSSFNRWLWRHVTSSDIASYRRCGHILTSWASIDHHRKQMWCQMLINCNVKRTSLGSNTNMHKNKV